MSIKSKIFAAAAALALVGGVGAAGVLSAGPASAATPPCGSACIAIFSQQHGTYFQPNYAVDVLRQGDKASQPTIPSRAANHDPAEDWSIASRGTVADSYTAGLADAAVALHYGCTGPPFIVTTCASMSTKSKVLAAAATRPCGSACIAIFSQQHGTYFQPNYAVDVLRQGDKASQPTIPSRAANHDPAEDWTAAFGGIVTDFHAAKLAPAAINLHYGGDAAGVPNDPASEIEYALFGGGSGLRMGGAETGYSGDGVTLRSYGISANTVWIADTYGSPAAWFNRYVALVNGSDTDFSYQFMTRPQLQVDNITASRAVQLGRTA